MTVISSTINSHRGTRSQLLSGTWKLLPDPDNRGREARWFERISPGAPDAPVPGIIQQVFPKYHGVAWYWLQFRPNVRACPGERPLLRFGAVDYLSLIHI